MRNVGLLLLAFCVLFACKKKAALNWEKTPASEQIQQFIDSSAYADGSDSLFLAPISNQTKGIYIGDAHSIVRVFSMESALAEVLKTEGASTFKISLQTWSGIAPWFNTLSDGVAFKHFNPIFIDWAAEFLIPSPQEKIEGMLLQSWYDESFRRTVWTYLSTHDYLTENTLWEGEVLIYKELVKSNNFQPVNYFDDRFRGKFDDFDYPFNPNKSDSFGASKALSFWMRRRMDGSEAACKNALNAILDIYEPDWRDKRH